MAITYLIEIAFLLLVLKSNILRQMVYSLKEFEARFSRQEPPKVKLSMKFHSRGRFFNF